MGSDMRFVDQDRSQLLGFFRNAPPDTEITPSRGDPWCTSHTLCPGKVRLVWEEGRSLKDQPSVLLVSAGDAKEFFAWVNTYLERWKPISSFIRVIADDSFRPSDLAERRDLWTSSLLDGALGILLAEAFTDLTLRSGPSQRPLRLDRCLATCSYVLGRSMALGWRCPTKVAEKWALSKDLLGIAERPLAPDHVLAPWSTLLGFGGVECAGHDNGPLEIMEVCETLHRTGEIEQAALGSLTKRWPDLREAFAHMNGPLEDRVRSFDTAVSSTFRKRRQIPRSIVFVCALLASRISPGTLDHVGILVPHLHRHRDIVLWYGLCAGVTKGSSLREHSRNLGRRILRDMTEDETVFSKPRCDLSVEELSVISVASSFVNAIPNALPGRLLVEVAPCVNTVLWSRHGTSRVSPTYPERERSDQAVDAAMEELERAVSRIRSALETAKSMRERGS